MLSGNHVANFAETFAEMEARGAARLVADAEDLALRVGTLLDDPTALETAKAAATAFTQDRTDMLDSIADRLIRALELDRRA